MFIPGLEFDADAVRAGLRLAMGVGTPVVESERPVFFWTTTDVAPTSPVDGEGVSFNPTYRPVRTLPRTERNVPCGIEYRDGEGKMENFGLIVPARVVLTFLDQDYLRIQGFAFVGIKGTKYWYSRTETPKGLVSVGIYRVHATSEDEG